MPVLFFFCIITSLIYLHYHVIFILATFSDKFSIEDHKKAKDYAASFVLIAAFLWSVFYYLSH